MPLVVRVIQREFGDVATRVPDPDRVVHRNTIEEQDAQHGVNVIVTIAPASAAALSSGRTLDAGMWISSPTGGAVPCARLLRLDEVGHYWM